MNSSTRTSQRKSIDATTTRHKVRDQGRLMDVATIARELGVSRKVAEKIHQQLPKYTLPGIRKVYVARTDVDKLIEAGKIAA